MALGYISPIDIMADWAPGNLNRGLVGVNREHVDTLHPDDFPDVDSAFPGCSEAPVERLKARGYANLAQCEKDFPELTSVLANNNRGTGKQEFLASPKDGVSGMRVSGFEVEDTTEVKSTVEQYHDAFENALCWRVKK